MIALNFLFLTNYACSLFMTGLIWFVQIVHYPLFHSVPKAEFKEYEHWHRWRTSSVVLPIMFIELVTSFWLLLTNLNSTQRPTILSGALFVVVIWVSTIFLQMPIHFKLQTGKDTERIKQLVSSNWIRTVSWTARSILLSTILIPK